MSDTQSNFWMDIGPDQPDRHLVEILMKDCNCTKERAITLLKVQEAETKTLPEILLRLFVTNSFVDWRW